MMVTKSASIASTGVILAVSSFFLPADAFVAPGPAMFSVSTQRQVSGRFHSSNLLDTPLYPHASTTLDLAQSPLLSPLKDLPFLIADGIDGEAAAFSDQINYFDGPIVTLLGVFGVAVAALVGFKLLTGQMDSAIEQVLVDFEATMKEAYPQRWQSDIRPRLEGLEGESRQQTLVQIMEEIQNNDPTFMSRVQEKMKK
jgi:hypothetical protein